MAPMAAISLFLTYKLIKNIEKQEKSKAKKGEFVPLISIRPCSDVTMD
jgi:hypothetical protein